MGFFFSLENKKEITQILNEVLLGKYGEDKLNCIKENAVKAIQNYSLQNVLNELNEVYTVK